MFSNVFNQPQNAVSVWKTPATFASNTPAFSTADANAGGFNSSENLSSNWFKKSTKREKSQEILCKTCNILCSSKQTYDDHIKGKKHLKREKDSRTYSCDICSIYCVTAEEQKEHFNSETHAESVKVQEYLISQAEEKKKEKKLLQLTFEQEAITKGELEEIKNLKADSGKWLSCDICNVKSNSEEMHQRHLDSKKHRARAHDVEMNKQKTVKEFSCGVCNYICYSAEDRDTHIQSDEHIRAAILHTGDNPLEKLADSDEPVVTPIKAADNTIWYPCVMCDCKMNSLENYRTHINSKKHKAKSMGCSVKSKQATKQKYTSEYLRENYNRFVLSSSELSSKITGDPGAFCAKCEIQFETPIKLEAHFLTSDHKNFQPIKRKYCFNQEVAIAKKSKTQNIPTKVTNGLEDYGYANPQLHVQYTPTTYNYLGQKQPSSYGYSPMPPAQQPGINYNYPSYNSHSQFQTTAYHQSNSSSHLGYSSTLQQSNYNNSYGFNSGYENTPILHMPYGCVPPPPPFPNQ